MSDKKAPQHPIEVIITIGANGRVELSELLKQVVELFEENPERLPSGCSGGWSGGWSVSTATREVTADDYRAELAAWRDEVRA